MKSLLFIFCLLSLFRLTAQDTAKINEIDRLVLEINAIDLPLKTDTLKNTRPGMEIVTLISSICKNGELYKCVYDVTAYKTEQGLVKHSAGVTNYYYHKNEIIKIERCILDKGMENKSVWYYWEGKPIHTSEKSANAEIMANDLLNTSKEIRKKVSGIVVDKRELLEIKK